MYRNNIKCRYCESGENETQELFESCDFTKGMRKNLDLKQETDQLELWRKLTRALKDVHKENKNKTNERNDNVNLETIDSENSQNHMGSEAPPATREKTCQGDHEGITTHAVVANSARDISVGAVIGD